MNPLLINTYEYSYEPASFSYCVDGEFPIIPESPTDSKSSQSEFQLDNNNNKTQGRKKRLLKEDVGGWDEEDQQEMSKSEDISLPTTKKMRFEKLTQESECIEEKQQEDTYAVFREATDSYDFAVMCISRDSPKYQEWKNNFVVNM